MLSHGCQFFIWKVGRKGYKNLDKKVRKEDFLDKIKTNKNEGSWLWGQCLSPCLLLVYGSLSLGLAPPYSFRLVSCLELVLDGGAGLLLGGVLLVDLDDLLLLGLEGVLLPALEVVVDLLLGLDLEGLCGVSSLCLLDVEALDLLLVVDLGVLDEPWLSTLAVLECWLGSTELDELVLSAGSG